MTSLRTVWRNLILASIWFLLILFVLIAYYLITGLDQSVITEHMNSNIPFILLFAQIMMLVYLLASTRKYGFNIFKNGWKTYKSKIPIDVIGGILTGSVIAITYIYFLSPMQHILQMHIGDYVPAGEAMTSLGKHTMVFFIANVILAPFVEESLYRNFAMTIFLKKYSKLKTVVITSAMFGLMHWLGGFWYIMLTGLFVGVPLAIIVLKRGNLIWAFTTHLVLNSIEFIHISSL
ncbi:CPBP family intramembrane glutamic endopeptidase [Arthrospiribacter ruber]|uniref:CPBP family intramembrane metalloprotease n=1 Tax=Arthrospiribacter ruber TaxID=2487934 RepID=A0A951M7H0_9BACT|nr:type II CAAX endopeptidase family protein [Arthrospiribacter ruber]MBW3466886.1 CPBP family intramembrane metalloprotease [Arthrospiribacter ruber]